MKLYLSLTVFLLDTFALGKVYPTNGKIYSRSWFSTVYRMWDWTKSRFCIFFYQQVHPVVRNIDQQHVSPLVKHFLKSVLCLKISQFVVFWIQKTYEFTTNVTIHGEPVDIAEDRMGTFCAKYGEVHKVKALISKAGLATGDMDVQVTVNRKIFGELSNILICRDKMMLVVLECRRLYWWSYCTSGPMAKECSGKSTPRLETTAATAATAAAVVAAPVEQGSPTRTTDGACKDVRRGRNSPNVSSLKDIPQPKRQPTPEKKQQKEVRPQKEVRKILQYQKQQQQQHQSNSNSNNKNNTNNK